MSEKIGTAVTRLTGRLKIQHRHGVIEFELRTPSEINKRGTKTILRIHTPKDIPMIEDGLIIDVNGVFTTLYTKDTSGPTENVPSDRRGDGS